MRNIAVGLAVTALLTSVAPGQTAPERVHDRVLQFKHAETAQNFQEIANLIRTIAEISQVSVNNDQRTLSLSGSADRIKLVEWLFNEVDVPINVQPASQQGQGLAAREYQLSSGSENVVGVFYLTHTETVQNLQEVATLIRTIADIRGAFTYNAPRVLALRGTSEQMALAEWLVNEMDKPAKTQPATQQSQSAMIRQYPLQLSGDPGGGKDIVRVFSVAHAETVQDFQEVATAVRTIADIRRAFTCNAPRIVAVRASAEQIALADWLLKELDKPATDASGLSSAGYEYAVPNERDNVVRVFYFPPNETVQDFQKITTQLRTTVNIRRVFTYTVQRAIVLRGTTDQVAQAERLTKGLDKPTASKQ